MRTEWSTADGKTYVNAGGAPLHYFEKKMDQILFYQLPLRQIEDPARTALDLKLLPAKQPNLACLVTTALPPASNKRRKKNSDTQNSYCFGLEFWDLQIVARDHLITHYDAIIRSQGRYLARQVVINGDENQTLLSVAVNTFEVVKPADSTLNPPGNAIPLEPILTPEEIREAGGTEGLPVKRVLDFPDASTASQLAGVAVLAGDVGKDGRIHDIEVLSSPSLALGNSVADSLRKWTFKPYRLKNGQPVEVQLLIELNYTRD